MSTTVPQNANRVTNDQIDAIMAAAVWTDTKLGEKTTVVCCKLPNGFEAIESSGCVDPANYDHGLGVSICRKRIVDQLWKLEGYALADRMNRPVGAAGFATDAAKTGEMHWPTLDRDGLSFGGALLALKNGKKVCRAGWNGKGMWLVLITPGNAMFTKAGEGWPMQDCIGMKTAQGNMQPGWLASQADMLADDWMLVD